ncbi:MAG: hypothetical protein ACI8RZ_000857 [Myxococcota bacterium]
MRCRFQCRSCGRLSPINRLHLTRSIRCLCCGQEQIFDPTLWGEGLDLAHAVADLAGPEPEGRTEHPRIAIDALNPHRDIGVSRIIAEHTINETTIQRGVHHHRSLLLEAFPGHPLCADCHQPLTVRPGSGELTTRCPGCDRETRWMSPDDQLLSMSRPAALLGVLSDVERNDHPEVRITPGDAQGITCSSCGAPLSLTGAETIITCRFCTLVSRVPKQLRTGQSADPVVSVWWLALSGPSPLRESLLTGAEQRDIEAPAPDPSPSAPLRMRRLLAGLAFPAAALLIVLGMAAAAQFL